MEERRDPQSQVPRSDKIGWFLIFLSIVFEHAGGLEWLTENADTFAGFVRSHLPRLYPYLVAALALLLAWVAFNIKKRWRYAYGVLEIFVAYASATIWFSSAEGFGWKEWIAFATIIYVAVRGLENCREAKKVTVAANAPRSNCS